MRHDVVLLMLAQCGEYQCGYFAWVVVVVGGLGGVKLFRRECICIYHSSDCQFKSLKLRNNPVTKDDGSTCFTLLLMDFQVYPLPAVIINCGSLPS